MESIDYEIIRSDRKTLSLQIRPDGQVLVRCPRRYPVREIQKFVESKRSWISAHLQKIRQQSQSPELTEAQLRSLRQQAGSVFPQRAAFFAPKVGVNYGRITVRMQKSRWGSCSGQGNLNFNLLLLLAPPEVLDYVVIHELCHRKQMNHSPAFWAEVAKVCPDYRVRKQWLKANGAALMRRAHLFD